MDPHFQENFAAFVNLNEAVFNANDGSKFLPSIGNMVSVTPTARMKTYGVANVPQQTRHARRIYVGGIPPNYIDEDGIRNFVNSVIAQGLGEENDHSYVLSVYVNQKKCFAFVELKSIELAAACLDLDGIVMKNVVLRILRANEYKPELIPHSLQKMVKFDLSHFQFGPTTAAAAQMSDQDEGFMERSLDSLIQFSSFTGLEAGSVTIVGFPFDETSRKNSGRVASSNTPKLFRSLLRKYKYGMIDNPEFDVDISRVKVLDVGDVLTGKSVDEAKLNLTTTTAELVARGCVPFVVGGSKELSHFSSSALLSLYGSKLAVIYISSRGDVKILDDVRFYSSKFPLNCQGRYVLFAAQGSEFSKDEAHFIIDRGGKIVWLTKNLRGPNAPSPSESFHELLREFETQMLPVVVTLDAAALGAAANPHASNINSPHGLDFRDFAEIAKLAGGDPNVVLVNLTDFSIEAEEHSRENFMPIDVFYHFLLGFSLRREPALNVKSAGVNNPSNYRRSFPSNISSFDKGMNKQDSSRPSASIALDEEGMDLKNLANHQLLMRNHSEFRQLPSESSLAWASSHNLRTDPRGLAKSSSTMSTISSNPAIDRYNRSMSSYTMRNSASFPHPQSFPSGLRPASGSPSIPGNSTVPTQSLPDILGELHSFDENIDLVVESERTQKTVSNFQPNLKMCITTHSNDTSSTLPYASTSIREALVSPNTLVAGHPAGFLFDDKLLSSNQNLENQDP